jgi:beta-galactosidase
MRSIIPFNDDWLFIPREVDHYAPDADFEPITLPHTVKILPHHNFDNLDYQFISTYRKRFTLPEPLNGRRLYIDFDAAMTACTVSINGHTLGDHEGGYIPFSFDLTDHLNPTGENVLQVRLDSTERPDIPPNGFVVDYLTFGGIYRDVSLRYVNPVHITDVFVRTKNVLTDTPIVEADVTIVNQGTTEYALDVVIGFSDGIEHGETASSKLTIQPGEKRTVTPIITCGAEKPILWSIEQPQLYALTVSIGKPSDVRDDPIDVYETRFGFREAQFRDDGFYLNGEKLKLMGLNRHQLYPYIGAAAPARLQRRDADILKYELGVNIVRTSHYPQSPHFLNRCDEIGLLVFEEIPGWQFIGDSDWKALVLRDVQAMIERDRNHPSIILWGVRINESWDDEALYRATNELAHKLDPTRQTGGVRNFIGSQFFEDVYTYNDFSNSVIEPHVTPYMVTEFSGHMYPTKTWDNELRQIEHALRHTRIQDKQLGMPNVAGAIGWCAFDYNTHRDFGSGDRVCYHGVMDIFRLPKFAAFLYESQQDARPVVRIATFWTPGDRDTGGNDPIHVFSNCDEIEIYLGEESWGRYKPDRATYPNLKHPPFLIPGLSQGATWGPNYLDLRAVGFKDGQPVAEHRISADAVPAQLILTADDAELHADGADMTRIAFKLADKYSNRLPFSNAVIGFELEGDADLIGENPFPLVGGQAALYLKARRTPGTVTVRARVLGALARPQNAEASVTVQIV